MPVSSFATRSQWQLFAAIGLACVGLGSIAIANSLLDWGVGHYLTRKTAHIAGGVVFLVAPFIFDGPAYPLTFAAGFAIIMAWGHFITPHLIRGVGGEGRRHTSAEVWYPIACGVAIAIGWGMLHNPWLGVLPTLFLGFGDAITGAVRTLVYGREVKGAAGSAAMLAVCCVLALLVHPYWIGLAGAVTATYFERVTIATTRWDDNPALTIGSAAVMAILYLGFAAG
jgi:dolichol kinase